MGNFEVLSKPFALSRRCCSRYLFTDRKAAEAALRESEDHYRHMVELNPQILWVLDAEGNATAISPRWEQVTGMSAANADRRGFLEAIHPEDILIDSVSGSPLPSPSENER